MTREVSQLALVCLYDPADNMLSFIDYVFLALTCIYLANIVIMMAGLGLKNFWLNGWNIFDVFAVMGTLATTFPLLLRQQSQVATQVSYHLQQTAKLSKPSTHHSCKSCSWYVSALS